MKTKFSIFEQEVRPFMGLDAEIVPLVRGVPVYPHQHDLAQERHANHMWELQETADWHGDGFAFELCTKPSHCIEVLLREVGMGLTLLRDRLGAAEQPGTVALSAPTIYEVPIDVVQSAPAKAKLLGCAPSFNVYVAGAARPEGLGEQKRTTGCHLHISDARLNDELAQAAVKWADILVGTAWTLISPEDSAVEKARREAYGRAGEHRRNMYPPLPLMYNVDGIVMPKVPIFGVEYRVLPGRVLTHPAYLSLMFRLYRIALMAALNNTPLPPEWSALACETINNSDKGLAERLVKELPFDEGSRKLLSFYQKRAMPVMSLNDWRQAGNNGYGCVSYYQREQ